MDPSQSRDLREKLRTIDEACGKAASAGDDAREAELHQEASVLLAALNDVPAARERIVRARALHAAAGRRLDEAKALYSLGFLDARFTDRLAGARAMLLQAVAIFGEEGATALVGRAHGHLASLALRAQDWGAAEEHFGAAAEAAAAKGDVPRVLEGLQLQAFTMQVNGRPNDAFMTLTRTIELARKHGSDADVLRLRLDLHHLTASPLIAPELQPEPLDTLVREAVDAGQDGLAGMALLTWASEFAGAGRIAEAREAAEGAREKALETTDPLLYTIACLLIADIEQRRGDRVAALTILFTCQATLGDLLGDTGRVPVLHVIDSLEKAWGKAAFRDALEKYRAQFPD